MCPTSTITDQSPAGGTEAGTGAAAAAKAVEGEFPHRLQSAIATLSRRLRHIAAASDLTPSQTAVLGTVVRSGPLRLTELAELEGINPTMLSRITSHLSAAGLIERTPDASDRRAALVSATSEGRRRRRRIRRERTRALEVHMAALSPEERASLAAALPALEHLAARLGERPS